MENNEIQTNTYNHLYIYKALSAYLLHVRSLHTYSMVRKCAGQLLGSAWHIMDGLVDQSRLTASLLASFREVSISPSVVILRPRSSIFSSKKFHLFRFWTGEPRRLSQVDAASLWDAIETTCARQWSPSYAKVSLVHSQNRRTKHALDRNLPNPRQKWPSFRNPSERLDEQTKPGGTPTFGEIDHRPSDHDVSRWTQAHAGPNNTSQQRPNEPQQSVPELLTNTDWVHQEKRENIQRT